MGGIGKSRIFLRILHDQAVFVVREILGGDHDDIHQRADAEATPGEQPEDARADLAGIEAMDAEIAQKDRKQQRHEPVPIGILATLHAGAMRLCRAIAAVAVRATEFSGLNRAPAIGTVFGFHVVVPPSSNRVAGVSPLRRGDSALDILRMFFLEEYDTASAPFCKGVYTIVTEIMKCGYICVAVFPRGEAHAFFTRGIAFFRENMVRIG